MAQSAEHLDFSSGHEARVMGSVLKLRKTHPMLGSMLSMKFAKNSLSAPLPCLWSLSLNKQKKVKFIQENLRHIKIFLKIYKFICVNI